MKYIARLIRSAETTLLFVCLSMLLIVGDGKQTVAEMVGAAGALAICTVALVTKKIRFTADAVSLWWAGLLLYALVLLPFSDSAGYSLYALLRLFIAFLLFVVFSGIPPQTAVYSTGVIVMTVAAVAFSVLFAAVPVLGFWLPGMSLLRDVGGHHHVVYLLLFTAPFIIRRYFSRPSPGNGMLAAGLFISLLFTRARGAWIAVALYFLYILFREKAAVYKFRVPGIALVAVLTALFFVTSATPGLLNYSPQGGQLIRKTVFSEARLGYWRQAWQAFRERPLFGTGMGTFFIQSVRYQDKPQSFSWFAHSYPLQFLAESGILGSILLLGLLAAVFPLMKNGVSDSGSKMLFEAVCLSAFYSIYEINLDYLALWMLVWSAAGLLAARAKTGLTHRSGRISMVTWYASIIVVGILYGVIAVTTTAQIIRGKKVFLEPYNAVNAIGYFNSLRGGSYLPAQVSMNLWFNRKNPDVLSAAALALQDADPSVADQLFLRAIRADPQNVGYLADYVRALLAHDDTPKLTGILTETAGNQTDFADPELSPLLTVQLFQDVGVTKTKADFMAKLYYFLGLHLVDTDPARTLLLWTRARNSAPWWGYFHVELARLEFVYFHNYDKARAALAYCGHFPSAQKQCSNTVIRDFTDKNTQYEQIRTISSMR